MPRRAENKSKQGKRNRTAGHNFEREIAKRLRAVYEEAERGLQYRNGIGCCDVEKTPFYIECKKGKRTNIKAALKQANEDGKADRRPKLAVTMDDNGPILVTMDWVTFYELIATKEYLMEKADD